MNVLLLKAWLEEDGPKLIGCRVKRANQLDERSIILHLLGEEEEFALLLSVLEEYPVLALADKSIGEAENVAEGNFCKALNFHLPGYSISSIQQSGFDRSVVFTLRHKDKYGQVTLKKLRAELAGRSANAFLISERDMVVSTMKRVRRTKGRLRQILTGKPLPAPPPLGKYIASEGSAEELGQELSALTDKEGTEGSLIEKLFTQRIAGGDRRIWQQLEPLIPVEHDIGALQDFIVRFQRGELTREIFELDSPGDENRTALELWQAAREKRNPKRKTGSTKAEKTASKLDQLIEQRRLAEQADDVETLATKMLSESSDIDDSGNAATFLETWAAENADFADQIDKRRSVYENANELIHYAQRLRRGKDKLDELIGRVQDELEALEHPSKAAKSPVSKQKQAQQDKFRSDASRLDRHNVKYLRFRSSDGFTILCGMNDRSNDELVRMFGSARHLWLHARDYPGSHVIVLDAGKQTPAATLEEAAVVAGWHSKGRNAVDLDVSYLPMNQLRRPRNAKPGQVLKTSESVITIRPAYFEDLKKRISVNK